MLSGAISIASSKGLSQKTPFQNCIPFITTFALGLELIGIISLIILYDKSDKSENLLFISTTAYLIVSTIYFAWHSVVKENSFELVAFSLMSTILNAVGIYLAAKHKVLIEVKITCIAFFGACQVLYYSLSIYSYRHFHKYLLGGHDETTFEKKLVAVRTFEMFISMIKVDFMLYIILIASYMYYVCVKWPDFLIPGCIIGITGTLFLIGHSILGIYAISREHVNTIILYFVLMIVALVVKAGFIVVITVEPEKGLLDLLVEQSYVVFTGDGIVYICILYLGYWTHKSFGIGAMSIIRKTNDDYVRAPFI